MKHLFKSFVSLIIIALFLLSLNACTPAEAPDNNETTTTISELQTEAQLSQLWKDAVYTEDKEFGNGSKTVTVEVTAEDKTVVFTVKTDKETVGDALIEHELIAGENGEYGLYIKSVNGILADYSLNQCYWAFYIGDEYASTGVDSTEITEGATYKLVYSK